MQFHHYGYVTTDPRVLPAAGVGLTRTPEIPDEVDLLIVGAGPAGMLLAAQMSSFPEVSTRLVERRARRLEVGRADGIQARSVETFQAFGFAERIVAEAYRFCATNFWSPDPVQPTRIVRTQRTKDDEHGVSEFPHLTVNQARVLDNFAEVAVNGPARIEPDFGWEFVGLKVTDGDAYPVQVRLRQTPDDVDGRARVVRAKYVVGTDGARSAVRESIGLELKGSQAMHAWAVLDALTVTDFPDIRTKCAIQSEQGSLLLIPREGGFLCRMYIDLGDVVATEQGVVRQTTVDEAIARANAILSPYVLEVRDVQWFSVYEVGHRLSDRFDNAGRSGQGRVFIAGDACHTHSAKAGQGMNVSMQDTFNLGWKLGQVLTGLSPESLLSTYTTERRVVAQNLIDFDRNWSAMMAKKPGEVAPAELAEQLVKSAEFTAGFLTEYAPSMVMGGTEHQALASGFPIGRRFKSAMVTRVADANPLHLGHQARADGRWRLYAFADGRTPDDSPALTAYSDWMLASPESPVNLFTSASSELDSIFDAKVVFRGHHHEVELATVPKLYFPTKGPFGVVDYEKVFSVNEDAEDIFEVRGIKAQGCVVVVRPDQYVAAVLPLDETSALSSFFEQGMRRASER